LVSSTKPLSTDLSQPNLESVQRKRSGYENWGTPSDTGDRYFGLHIR
jgi:hypothetical protein